MNKKKNYSYHIIIIIWKGKGNFFNLSITGKNFIVPGDFFFFICNYQKNSEIQKRGGKKYFIARFFILQQRIISNFLN